MASPSSKTERLLNLTLCLLYTRRPLTKARIRSTVPQYAEAASAEAFDRMFERDKDELRELGIPLVTELVPGGFDDEQGYRIDQREYALPEIDFEPDELAVLGLASRTWAQASLAGPAAQALRKLEAAGVERDGDSLIGIEPRLRTSEPAFGPVKDAVVSRRPITFGYRKSGDVETSERHLQPWGLASWHGRWYLTGFDEDRGAPRVFRLSRIEGEVRTHGPAGSVEVPADHAPHEMIRTVTEPPATEPSPAVVDVRVGAGHSLRRRARAVTEVDGDWSRLDLDYRDADGFADELSGFGASVVVREPAEVRDAVVRRLRGVLETTGASSTTGVTGTTGATGGAA